MTHAAGQTDTGAVHLQYEWFIRATPDRVFSAWTDPAELGWFYNDAMPWPDVPIEVDLRVGGAWRQMMVIDATKRYFTGGIYREIVPGRRLVFAWGAVDGWPALSPERLDDSPQVAVTFNARAGGTEMIVDVDLPADLMEQAAREGFAKAIRAGWQVTVDRLERALGA